MILSRQPSIIRSWRTGLLAMLALLGAGAAGWGAEASFRQPLCFTANDATTLAQNMSRSTHGQLLWLPNDKALGLVYWEGEDVTSSSDPVQGRIYFREWTPQGEWGTRRKLNTPATTSGVEYGGRHPVMITDAQGGLFVAWHDYRNALVNGSAVTLQTEIYGQRRPAGGDWSASDIRLTNSGTASAGDNRYLPRLARLSDGRLVLAWYDFHWDPNLSQLAIKLSGTDGVFTNSSFDDVAHEAVSGKMLTIPDVAAGADGMVHVAWSQANLQPSAASTFDGLFNPATGEWSGGDQLAAKAGGYYDPAKWITNAAGGGELWLLYTDYGTASNNEIMLRRRGASAFESPVRITTQAGSQHTPDAAFDAKGVAHMVYVDDSADMPAVIYRTYDPASGVLSEPIDLTAGQSGDWTRPAVTVDPSGNVYVVWEDTRVIAGDTGDASGLWFTTNYTQNAAHDWALYQ